MGTPGGTQIADGEDVIKKIRDVITISTCYAAGALLVGFVIFAPYIVGGHN